MTHSEYGCARCAELEAQVDELAEQNAPQAENFLRLAEKAGCNIHTIPGVGKVARYDDPRVTNLLARFYVDVLRDLAEHQRNKNGSVGLYPFELDAMASKLEEGK